MTNSEAGKSATKKTIWVAALAIVIAVLGAGSFYIARTMTLHRSTYSKTRIAPFTLRQEMYSYNKLPGGVLSMKSVVARRSDGAMVRSNSMFDELGHDASGKTKQMELPDGTQSMVFDDIEAVIKEPARPAAIQQQGNALLLNPPTNCASKGESFIAYTSLQGYEVSEIQLPVVADGKRFTVWRFRELGCIDLEAKDELPQGPGSWKLMGQTRLVNLSLGEPDAALFNVPANYRSVMPSEAMRKQSDYLGTPWTDVDEAYAKRWDANYTRLLQTQQTSPPKTAP